MTTLPMTNVAANVVLTGAMEVSRDLGGWPLRREVARARKTFESGSDKENLENKRLFQHRWWVMVDSHS